MRDCAADFRKKTRLPRLDLCRDIRRGQLLLGHNASVYLSSSTVDCNRNLACERIDRPPRRYRRDSLVKDGPHVAPSITGHLNDPGAERVGKTTR